MKGLNETSQEPPSAARGAPEIGRARFRGTAATPTPTPTAESSAAGPHKPANSHASFTQTGMEVSSLET